MATGSEARAIRVDGRDVPVELRVSARARRFILRVARRDGRVTLTVPQGADPDEGMAFVRSRTDWVRRQLGRAVEARRPAIGEAIPIEGIPRRIARGPGSRIALLPAEILVPDAAASPGPAIAGFLRHLCRERVVGHVDRLAPRVGRQAGRITLRDTRSRWGSCSAAGSLMFSWRLVMAPPEVLRYVVAHEVAHLVHMDHSRSFWNLVEQLDPDHAPRRRWLREHGASLQAWQFTDD
ncbi:MAG: M48 family peptidase [Alphaproteobacteria bacterium]|nr:MAG: M48 family peptidase [Alphaproteobacteria bacterium]